MSSRFSPPHGYPSFSGHDFLTTTGSSATSHRVSNFLSCLLKSPTDPIRRGGLPDDARLPQLLCWLPVDDYVLKHQLSLSMNWASCLFAHSPRQPAESGSLTLRSINLLSLPSDPAVGQRRPCESDSLPHGQGMVAEKEATGFASFAGQTKKPVLAHQDRLEWVLLSY